MGVMYENGWAVKQDYAAAAKWYRKAAARGYGGAQNHLALLYAQGLGVSKDLVEAEKWFELGETHGDHLGPDVRAQVSRDLTPDQLAEAKKRVAAFVPRD
jgi:TPR repeat protein